MAGKMGKSNNHYQNIFKIIFSAFGVYLKNIIPLTKMMLFPIFGQILGVALILYPTYLLSQNVTRFFPPPLDISNLLAILVLQIIIILPGFFVFTKAFWEYIVAMASLNSVIAGAIKQGTTKEIPVQVQMIKLKTGDYVILLLLLSLLWIIGLALPFVIVPFLQLLSLNSIQVTLLYGILEFLSLFLLMIVSVYLSLSFQVFALENLSPVDTIKKSWNLVEGNFWRTISIAILAFIITVVLMPMPIQYLVSNQAILVYLIKPVTPYTALVVHNLTVLSNLNPNVGSVILKALQSFRDPVTEISSSIVVSVIGMALTGLLLPLSTAFYTLLYLDILKRKTSKAKKK